MGEDDRQRRPQQGQGRGRDERGRDAERPEEQAARERNAGVGTLVALVCATLLAASLRLPWIAVAPVLAVVTVVVCVRRLRSTRGTPAAVWNPLVVASLAMSAFVLLITSVTMVTFPAQLELQTCRDRALTAVAEAECEAAFGESVLGPFSAVSGR